MERQVLQSMAQRFCQSKTLFVPNPERTCPRREVALSSSGLPVALLATADAAFLASVLGSSADGDDHADLDVTLIFTCVLPQRRMLSW